MRIHLVDGTYELFRHYHALPKLQDGQGREVAAVRGVLASMLSLVKEGATHIGIATDHIIESFRNDLYPGYKTGAGVPEDLMAQFPLLEEALRALGLAVWAMTEFEADDALAAAAQKAAEDPRVEQVLICTPDKDLAQCVVGDRVIQFDRRKREARNEAGVVAKFGVPPASIADYLALVGDTADGYPGLPGWGAKGTAAVLAKYGHIDAIPTDFRTWNVRVTNPAALSETLQSRMEDALLFRTLATLRTDTDVFATVDDLQWRGPTDAFEPLAAILDANVKRETGRGAKLKV
ncbi:5'-3' exonuclease [Terriglobus aquaticus]|uniref:5'-3' exonuclease H3TH domain-containing protein n=1 Tax=Terriglobus aquaticus TaxID=940139 RepID=A0ABW9KLG3_9BACT|nr:5'-3' exonuclease H3TH domain-containing protein [Terriglobus aquaticus]